MLSQTYYLIRSRQDGSYLVAHPDRGGPAGENSSSPSGYLLMFREHFDALSYLNKHGAGVADRFAVETIAGAQVANLLKRWGFSGIGMVQDPLLPRVEFLTT
jgi:hypothetical protein